MTATITMKLEGMDSLLATLQALPTRVSNRLVKPAMQEAGSSLKDQLRWNAWKQLQGALGRGYKDKDSINLYRTTAARAKSYKKGETTFVAVGFDYAAGGKHAHLVELGHRIVTGGTQSKYQDKMPGLTAAGRRWLSQLGWNYEVLGGKGRKTRRAWKNAAGAIAPTGQFSGEFFQGKRIRGGGKSTGGMTRAFPMLAPAFDTMKRPMMLAIEHELKKIDAEAIRLAQEKGIKK